MAEAGDRVRQLAEQVDGGAVRALIAAVGVRTSRVRSRLHAAGLSFVGQPDRAPEPWELDRAAQVVIGWSRANVGMVGGMTGLGGILGLPPEAAALVVARLRLAQRLAVVFGFDPETDRGRVAVARALAAAWELDLPPGGVEGMRVSEIARLAVARAPRPSLPSEVATAVAVRSALSVFGRFGRLVPLLGSAVAVVEGQSRIEESGRLMVRVLRRLAGAPEGGADVEDAVEVPEQADRS